MVLASGYYFPSGRLDVPLRYTISPLDRARAVAPHAEAGIQPRAGAALLRALSDRDGAASVARRVPRGELLLSRRAGNMVHHVDPRRVLQAGHRDGGALIAACSRRFHFSSFILFLERI